MSKSIIYTHKGWFGLCPIYLAEIDSPAPYCDPRHWSLAWLMTVSDAIYSLCFWLGSYLNPDYVPAWPLLVSGVLKTPIIRTRED